MSQLKLLDNVVMDKSKTNLSNLDEKKNLLSEPLHVTQIKMSLELLSISARETVDKTYEYRTGLTDFNQIQYLIYER